MTKVIEAPQNGLAGLKHWRADIGAGFLVAMISIPFSIGIAIASGAPPITGLTSAIIAGLILPLVGGSYVTISGPAAGLAPILYQAILTLGLGNMTEGYLLLLPIICLVGIIQIILCGFKIAKYSSIFPISVIEGMLAAIGLMIIVKQFPSLIGHQYIAHDFWPMVIETPHELIHANQTAFGIGLFTLVLIFSLKKLLKTHKIIKVLPPQILAVFISTLISIFFLDIDSDLLINLPNNPLHGLAFPDFKDLLLRQDLYYNAAQIILTLTLIDGIESLATIKAIDKIDPHKRHSNPNRTLFAIGLSNVCSSFIGGLTIIPGGVRSTANIMAGGKTQWANFYNACFLIAFMLLARPLINQIPLSVLAAVLIYTGFNLCRPRVWKHVAKIGPDQILQFSATAIIVLCTDLMIGIISGVTIAYLSNLYYSSQAEKNNFFDYRLFTNPIESKSCSTNEATLYLNKNLSSFNLIYLQEVIKKLPIETRKICINISGEVSLIEHTVLDYFHSLQNKYELIIVGLEKFKKLSNSSSSTRVRES
jgi:carbonic anhydrase